MHLFTCIHGVYFWIEIYTMDGNVLTSQLLPPHEHTHAHANRIHIHICRHAHVLKTKTICVQMISLISL